MGKPGAEESLGCCTRKGWGGRIHFNEAAEERGWLPGQRPPTPVMLGHAAGIKAALGIIRWERCKTAGPATTSASHGASLMEWPWSLSYPAPCLRLLLKRPVPGPGALSTPPAWVAHSVHCVDAQGHLWLPTVRLIHAMLPALAHGVFRASAPAPPPFILEHGSGLSQACLAQ